MPRRVGHRDGRCTVCNHPEAVRIDYLIATGVEIRPLGRKFNINYNSIYNHSKKHVSDEYRKAIRIGPFGSEEQLRQLCAENGISVLEMLRAMNAGVQSRWLAAL